ncbi:putative RasGEF domain containing protein [Blattamonas nauphoetae]|uniref:RasGEF domain containing protein n=1 Tax=Blattamonas nauphoetae TaxID=2049346 RepID=A0ABQ9XF71_9EUKA|nr:putative RasGEF domain containing protein [Blattamonas nauphoetae]
MYPFIATLRGNSLSSPTEEGIPTTPMLEKKTRRHFDFPLPDHPSFVPQGRNSSRATPLMSPSRLSTQTSTRHSITGVPSTSQKPPDAFTRNANIISPTTTVVTGRKGGFPSLGSPTDSNSQDLIAGSIHHHQQKPSKPSSMYKVSETLSVPSLLTIPHFIELVAVKNASFTLRSAFLFSFRKFITPHELVLSLAYTTIVHLEATQPEINLYTSIKDHTFLEMAKASPYGLDRCITVSEIDCVALFIFTWVKGYNDFSPPNPEITYEHLNYLLELLLLSASKKSVFLGKIGDIVNEMRAERIKLLDQVKKEKKKSTPVRTDSHTRILSHDSSSKHSLRSSHSSSSSIHNNDEHEPFDWDDTQWLQPNQANGQDYPPTAVRGSMTLKRLSGPSLFGVKDSIALSIAVTLTHIEDRLVKLIQINEFLDANWLSDDKAVLSPNIVKMTQHFNRVTSWVPAVVLSYDTPKKRAKMWDLFISVAEELRKLKNYNGLMEIIFGMEHRALKRLKETKKQRKKSDESLMDLLERPPTYPHLVRELNRTLPPKIVILPLLLKEVIYAENWGSFTETVSLKHASTVELPTYSGNISPIVSPTSLVPTPKFAPTPDPFPDPEEEEYEEYEEDEEYEEEFEEDTVMMVRVEKCMAYFKVVDDFHTSVQSPISLPRVPILSSALFGPHQIGSPSHADSPFQLSNSASQSTSLTQQTPPKPRNSRSNDASSNSPLQLEPMPTDDELIERSRQLERPTLLKTTSSHRQLESTSKPFTPSSHAVTTSTSPIEPNPNNNSQTKIPYEFASPLEKSEDSTTHGDQSSLGRSSHPPMNSIQVSTDPRSPFSNLSVEVTMGTLKKDKKQIVAQIEPTTEEGRSVYFSTNHSSTHTTSLITPSSGIHHDFHDSDTPKTLTASPSRSLKIATLAGSKEDSPHRQSTTLPGPPKTDSISASPFSDVQGVVEFSTLSKKEALDQLKKMRTDSTYSSATNTRPGTPQQKIGRTPSPATPSTVSVSPRPPPQLTKLPVVSSKLVDKKVEESEPPTPQSDFDSPTSTPEPPSDEDFPPPPTPSSCEEESLPPTPPSSSAPSPPPLTPSVHSVTASQESAPTLLHKQITGKVIHGSKPVSPRSVPTSASSNAVTPLFPSPSPQHHQSLIHSEFHRSLLKQIEEHRLRLGQQQSKNRPTSKAALNKNRAGEVVQTPTGPKRLVRKNTSIFPLLCMLGEERTGYETSKDRIKQRERRSKLNIQEADDDGKTDMDSDSDAAVSVELEDNMFDESGSGSTDDEKSSPELPNFSQTRLPRKDTARMNKKASGSPDPLIQTVNLSNRTQSTVTAPSVSRRPSMGAPRIISFESYDQFDMTEMPSLIRFLVDVGNMQHTLVPPTILHTWAHLFSPSFQYSQTMKSTDPRHSLFPFLRIPASFVVPVAPNSYVPPSRNSRVFLSSFTLIERPRVPPPPLGEPSSVFVLNPLPVDLWGLDCATTITPTLHLRYSLSDDGKPVTPTSNTTASRDRAGTIALRRASSRGGLSMTKGLSALLSSPRSSEGTPKQVSMPSPTVLKTPEPTTTITTVALTSTKPIITSNMQTCSPVLTPAGKEEVEEEESEFESGSEYTTEYTTEEGEDEEEGEEESSETVAQVPTPLLFTTPPKPALSTRIGPTLKSPFPSNQDLIDRARSPMLRGNSVLSPHVPPSSQLSHTNSIAPSLQYTPILPPKSEPKAEEPTKKEKKHRIPISFIPFNTRRHSLPFASYSPQRFILTFDDYIRTLDNNEDEG